jgi:hypothetical protein
MGQVLTYIKSDKQIAELDAKYEQKFAVMEKQQENLMAHFTEKMSEYALMQKMNLDRQIVFETKTASDMKFVKKSFLEIEETFHTFFQEFDLQVALQNKRIEAENEQKSLSDKKRTFDSTEEKTENLHEAQCDSFPNSQQDEDICKEFFERAKKKRVNHIQTIITEEQEFSSESISSENKGDKI